MEVPRLLTGVGLRASIAAWGTDLGEALRCSRRYNSSKARQQATRRPIPNGFALPWYIRICGNRLARNFLGWAWALTTGSGAEMFCGLRLFPGKRIRGRA